MVGDARDETTWVVLELTSQGERMAEDATLEEILRDLLGAPTDHPIFIPYLSYLYAGVRSLFNVMEGYAFVGTGLDDHAYFHLLQSNYIKQVMSRPMGGHLRVLETIPDVAVRDLRQQLCELIAVEIQDSMEVQVTEGPYTGIFGSVVGIESDHALVLIEMRSLRAIKRLPRFLLRPRGDDE